MEGHEPTIDAVGLVRRIRDDLYEETKNLTNEELIAFYHGRAAATKERLARLHVEREMALRSA
ncbi:MAG TPA: hypothetical protein DD490_32875 [Acidobacteria bacterium]|nr:hypothetical protein [Acidobacteriota bacterium]